MTRKFFFFLALMLLSSLALVRGQFTSIPHKPVYLFRNHEENSKYIDFQFTVGSNIQGVYDGFAFVLKFPDKSIVFPIDSVGFDCQIFVDGVQAPSFFPIRNINTEPDTLFCQYLGKDVNGVKLANKNVKIRILNLTYKMNFFETVSISFDSSTLADRITIERNSAFKAFAVYNEYKDLQATASWTVSDVKIWNTTPSTSCAAPCKVLYPFSSFTIEFTNTITQNIDTKEVYIVIGFADVNGNDSTYTVASTPYIGLNNTSQTASNSLSANSQGLKLSQFLNRGRYELQNIGENLYAGRKFKLSISGFDTDENVGKYGTENLVVEIFWRNTNSILSYYYLDISSLTYINSLDFQTGGTGSNIANSITHPYKTDIFENGTFQLKFNIRIPGVSSDGVIQVTHVSTRNTVFSFVPSTCDFSENSDGKYTTLGLRPVCAPRNPLEDFSNGSVRRVSKIINETQNNSTFSFQMSKAPNSSRDFVFTVWGFANRCNNENFELLTNSDLGYENLLSSLSSTSFPLLFRISFITSKGNTVADNEFYTSGLNCYKNLAYYNKGQDLSISNYIYQSANNVIGPNRDYHLYRELYDWNFMSINYAAPVNSANPEPFYQRNIASYQEKYLNEVDGNVTNNMYLGFFLNTSGTLINSIPFPNYHDGSGTGSVTPTGYLTFGFYSPMFNYETFNQNACSVRWFDVLSNGTLTNQQRSFSNANTNTVYQLKSVTSTNIVTNSINTSINSTDGLGNPIVNIMPTFQGNLDSYLSGGSSLSALGFYTDCFSIKNYSSVSFKSIYSVFAEITIRFFRSNSDNTGNVNTRSLRLLKFFSGSKTFIKNSQKSISFSPTKFYYATENYDTNKTAKLCLLSIVGPLFDSMESTDTAVLLTFLHAKVPVIDDFSNSIAYPTGNNLGSVVTYQGYSTEPIANFDASNFSQNNSYIGNLIYSNNSILFNNKSPLYYFGSTLLITGISGNQATVVKATTGNWYNNDLYIPMHCPDGIVHSNTVAHLPTLSINFINIDGNGVPKSNLITTVTNTDGTNFRYLRFINENFNDLTMSVAFSDFRQNSTDLNNNTFSYTMKTVNPNGGPVTYTAKSILMLSNLTESPSTTPVLNNLFFFGQTYVTSFRLTSSIAGYPFSKMYFYHNDAGFTPSDVYRFSRPAFGTEGKYYCNVQAYYSGSNGGQNYHAYVSNSQANQVVSYPANPMTNTATPDLFQVAFRSIGAYYVNDYGGNFTFVVTVSSDFPFNNGVLNINVSQNLRKFSRCTLTLNPLQECQIVDTSNILCTNISVQANLSNQVLVSCYNLFTNNTGVLTVLKNTTTFSVANYINYSLKADVSVNYIQTTSAQDISTVVPKIIAIEYTQSRQNKGLGNAFIRVDLGRGVRLGQTIVITGAISDLYIQKKRPNCWYSFTNKFSYLDTLSLFDDYTTGNYFIQSCNLNTAEGEAHTITITTLNDYIPIADKEFSRYLVIKLDPVYALNLATAASNGFYSIQSYLNNDTTMKICADPKVGANRDTFPSLNPAFPSILYSPVPATSTGLCDLVNVFPRLSGTLGTYTFNINLTGAALALTNANVSGTNKVLNEVSIYMNRLIYQANSSILCSYGSILVPCEWTDAGFINIKFYVPLLAESTSNLIKIIGVPNPYTASAYQDDTFNCSVNYNFYDSRENILIGRGQNAIYTFSPAVKGNLLFRTNDFAMVSDTTPRVTTKYNLRFFIDNTQNINSTAQSFPLTEDTTPVIYVRFPVEYFFDFKLSNITVSLLRTDYDLKQDNTITKHYLPALSIGVASIMIIENYIKITLAESLESSSITAYFDLTLNNIPNPDFAGNASDISVTILDDDVFPTKVFRSYSNLNNSGFNVFEKTNIHDLWQGPSFSFSDSLKYIIDPVFPTSVLGALSINPGRYNTINFTLTGQGDPASTNLSLNPQNYSVGSLFKTLEDYVTLDTNLNTAGSIRLGVPCNTFFGIYIVKFQLSNYKSFYNLAPLKVTVNKIFENLEQIRLRPVGDLDTDISTFTLYPTFTHIQAAVNNLPFEDVFISITNTTQLFNNFRNITGPADHTIKARSYSAYFKFAIDSYTNQQVLMRFNSENRCFGFQFTSSRTVSFVASQLIANMKDIDLSKSFSYDSLQQGDANYDATEITINFSKSVTLTNGVFALICADAEMPNYNQIFNYYLNQTNIVYSADTNLDYQRLVQVHLYTFLTDQSNVKLVFSNLQRGQKYRFLSWLSDFNFTNSTIISYHTFTLPQSSNTTNIKPLAIPDIIPPQYLKFSFTQVQPLNLLERLTFFTQSFLSNFTQGNLVVFDYNETSVVGFNVTSKVDCLSSMVVANPYSNGGKQFINFDNVTFRDPVPAINNSSNANTTVSNSTKVGLLLRNLAENSTSANTTANNTITTTNNTSNNTNNNLPKVTYKHIVWFKWLEDPLDAVEINLPNLLNDYFNQFSTANGLSQAVNNPALNISFTGDLNLANVKDINLHPSNFTVSKVTVEGQKISVVTSAAFNYTNCFFQLADLPSRNYSQIMSVEDIMNCEFIGDEPVPFWVYDPKNPNNTNDTYYSTETSNIYNSNSYCGKSAFYDRSSTITRSVVPGNYSFYFACLSEIPLSPEFAVFKSNNFEVLPPPVDTKVHVFYNCTVNSTDTYCLVNSGRTIYSSFAGLLTMLLILLLN